MSVDVSRIPNNNKFDPVREAILDLEQQIVSGVAGVGSVNNQTGAVTIAQGNNVSITTNNGVITISSTAGGGGGPMGELTLAAGGGIGLSSPSVFDGTQDLTVTITNTDRPNDGQLNIITGAGITTLTGDTWSQKNINWSVEPSTWASSAGASFSANASQDANINIAHGATSSVTDVVNVGGNVIQSMGFDQFGHVQSTASRNLDDRYLIWRSIYTSNDNRTATASAYNDMIEFKGAGSIAVTKSPTNDEIRFGLAVSDIRFENGKRVARGFLYWQANTVPTAGDVPSNSKFSFDSYLITINDSDWSETPPTTGYSLTTYYIVRYTSIDDGAGTTASRNVTYGVPETSSGFEGPVTFNSLSEELGSNGFTVIDGGRIKTGRIQSIGLNTTDLDQGLSVYTNQGSFFDLNSGDLVTMDFSVISGNGSFKGDVTGASGTFGSVDLNKNGYFINAPGFQLDLNGAVTIGGSKFNIPVYADDAVGTNKSFTLQAGQEYVLFFESDVPKDQLNINTVTGTWTKFIGDDGATGPAGADGTDGTDGSDGLSTFLASIYRRSASAPATPTGGSYNFGTTTLTPPSGWSATVPSGTDPLYVSTALARIQGITGIDSTLNWSTPVILAQDGADGQDGTDGADGTNGTNGSNGLRTATGLVFYQFGSATTPSTPSASNFDFSTGDFVGLSSGWATTTPDMSAGTSTNRYYSSYYVVTETFAGSGIGSATFDTPIRSFSFNQVVTFDSLSSSGTTIINGDNITTGVIASADYVSQSGSVFSADGMAINLNSLSIETPSFAIDGNGDAYFSSGDIAIGSNKITLKAQNFYSSLGEIEFQNETGAMAANMRVTSYGTNEVTIASYVSGTTKGNQLIVGSGRFYLGRSNGSFLEEDSLDYLRLFGASGIKLPALATTSLSANLYMSPTTTQLFRSTSSLRYKKDVEDYERGIDDVKKLRPVTFRPIEQDGGDKFAGFIAEEVHDSGLTEYVDYNENNEPESVHYAQLVTLLTKAVQEQQAQIENLTQEIQDLKSKIVI